MVYSCAYFHNEKKIHWKMPKPGKRPHLRKLRLQGGEFLDISLRLGRVELFARSNAYGT